MILSGGVDNDNCMRNNILIQASHMPSPSESIIRILSVKTHFRELFVEYICPLWMISQVRMDDNIPMLLYQPDYIPYQILTKCRFCFQGLGGF